MGTPSIPDPNRVRRIEGGFGFIDHRIRLFWEDMSQAELLLYFFLATNANETGCSWWSSRKICKVLKIGPASLIKARETLEQRRLIATTKDEIGQRTIYQVLPLPIMTNDKIEVPYKPLIKQTSDSPRPSSSETATEDSAAFNIMQLQRLRDQLK